MRPRSGCSDGKTTDVRVGETLGERALDVLLAAALHPDEHGWPRAGERGADRAVREARADLGEPRRVVGAVRLVQPVGRARGKQGRIACSERGAEQRGPGRAEGRVLVGNRLRQQLPRMRGEDAGLGNDRDDCGREVVGDAGDVTLPREADTSRECSREPPTVSR